MRVRVPLVAVTAIASVVTVAACSRQPAPAPPANQSSHDAHGAAPAPGTPRTALLGNLGAYHRAIKTANDDAQKFFDEGLTLLYGFNHDESFKSFEIAAAKDAASPMPHWGMSLALGTNINDIAPAERLKQAYTHLAEAAKRKSAERSTQCAATPAFSATASASATSSADAPCGAAENKASAAPRPAAAMLASASAREAKARPENAPRR